MVTRRKFLGLLGGGAAAVVAAGGGWMLLPGEEKLGVVPNIKLGKEACFHCGMIISDERFAAARRQSETKELHFDDIGCLISSSRKLASTVSVTYFVHELEGDGWIDGPTAGYVTAPNVKSPMGYGLGAFKTAETAKVFAERYSGKTTTWTELIATLEERT